MKVNQRCLHNCTYLAEVPVRKPIYHNAILQREYLRLMIFSLVLLLGTSPLVAQNLDLKVLGNYKRIELPFEIENDFIVLNVLLDGKLPLRFIVDTGAENTILLEKTITDMLAVNYQRTFQIRGADVNNPLIAYLATGIDLQIANRLLARNRSMLVLGENYFDFKSITGTNIQGILGADFLMRFTVEFDFKRSIIILHEPSDWKATKRHKRIPAEFIRNRAYLKVPVGVNTPSTTTRKLLLDSGAGLSLLMHTFGDSTEVDLPIQTIPALIANGLGGSMSGNVGRTQNVEIAGKTLNGVITYFQPLDTTGLQFLNNREGIIGNRMLKRFNVVINYTGRQVWFRPEGKRWREKFVYDRSGISIVAGGPNLRTYTIANIVPGSPADRVGIKVGDRLTAVNGKPVALFSIDGILSRFEGKVGRKIKLRYRRNGEYFIVRFRLEDLI